MYASPFKVNKAVPLYKLKMSTKFFSSAVPAGVQRAKTFVAHSIQSHKLCTLPPATSGDNFIFCPPQDHTMTPFNPWSVGEK